MRLIYFDEAGIGSIKAEPITTVAAVVVHGDREMPVVNAKVRAFRSRLPQRNNDARLRATDVRSGN